LMRVKGKTDALQGKRIAIVKLEVSNRDFRLEARHRGRACGPVFLRDSALREVRDAVHATHFTGLPIWSTRAVMESARTAKVMRRAPVQASCCHSLYGLSANWKMTTGRLAIGAFKFVLKNWLFSAVKSRGAVSPLMQAMARRSAVVRPARAAR